MTSSLLWSIADETITIDASSILVFLWPLKIFTPNLFSLKTFWFSIHSLDSLRLAKEIDKQAVKNKRVIECLIQYRISSEETKFGLNENEVLEIIKLKDNFKGIKIIGLMGMASFVDDQNIIDNEFKKLKILFDKIKLSNKKFKIISMGMTLDYNLAIKNGSNMIRIGSKIFGERNV